MCIEQSHRKQENPSLHEEAKKLESIGVLLRNGQRNQNELEVKVKIKEMINYIVLFFFIFGQLYVTDSNFWSLWEFWVLSS